MTTAATTEFTHDSITVDGLAFHFDGNQKICRDNGTFEDPGANAFSLLQIDDCPYRTPLCERACYVHNLEEHQPALHALYAENSRNMRRVVDSWDEKIDGDRVAVAFGDWIKKHASGGFRWHVSGDIFSLAYAYFITIVCQESPKVDHWIYTRSFRYIPALRDAKNLVVNISADEDNYTKAKWWAEAYNLRICYLTESGEVPADLREGDVIFPDYGLRGTDQRPHTYREGSEWWRGLTSEQRRMVCPIDAYGKSENCRCGPCAKCLGRAI